MSPSPNVLFLLSGSIAPYNACPVISRRTFPIFADVGRAPRVVTGTAALAITSFTPLA